MRTRFPILMVALVVSCSAVGLVGDRDTGSIAWARADRPRDLAGPASLEHRELALPPCTGAAVRATFPASRAPQPRLLPGEPPLAPSLTEPQPPCRPELSAGAPARWPSPSLDQPPPLPLLARSQLERVPIEDPTVEASTRAALQAAPPARTTPIPFVRQDLPDPFEYRPAVRLRTPLEEDVAPPAVPGPPKP